MASTLLLEDQIEIPMGIDTLAKFRESALSPDFPERGRIDYIDGRIEVDMSPEDVFCHSKVKTELIRVLATRVKQQRLGDLFSDRMRVSSPLAELSSEPDILFVSNESIASGRVLLVPKASGEEGRFVEIEGGVDLVIEIVSDSSVEKDTERMPSRCFAAGVDEYWLVDARGGEMFFQIHTRGDDHFMAVVADDDGYQHSGVFDCTYRLERYRDDRGYWTFDLLEGKPS